MFLTKVNNKVLVKYIVVVKSLIYLTIITGYKLYTVKINALTGIILIFDSIYLLYLSRKNVAMLFVSMFIMYSNYSIVVSRYLMFFDSELYKQINDIKTYFIGINILLLFLIFLIIFIPVKSRYLSNFRGFYENKNKSMIIVILISVVLLLILIFAFGRPSTIGERGTPTPLYEYSIILFIIGYYYTGNSTILRRILSIILFLFAFQNLIYGGRITALQLLIVYYFSVLFNKISLKNTFYLGIVMFVIMSIIGVYRGEIININKNGFEVVTSIIEDMKKNMLVLDTAYSAYFTSLTFIEVKDMLSFNTQIELLINYIKYTILGGGVANSNLSIFTRQYFVHYFGGLLPFYFYFWLGWIGVIIPSYIVSLYYNNRGKSTRKNNAYLNMLGLYFVVTTPRWYLYAPTQLFRGMIIFTVVFYIFKVLYLIFETKNKYVIRLYDKERIYEQIS